MEDKKQTTVAGSGRRFSRWWSGPELILLGLVLIFIALDAYAIYVVFSSRYPGAVDFYPRWHAARSLTMEGRNPYDPTVARETQLGLIWPPHAPLQRPGWFCLPLIFDILYLPTHVYGYPVAQAVWMAVLQAVLLAGVIFCFKIVAWRPPLWLVTFTFFGVSFFIRRPGPG